MSGLLASVYNIRDGIRRFRVPRLENQLYMQL